MNEHKCLQNKLADEIKIIYGSSIDEDWQSWILQVLRIARAQDVYDGEAETIGEILRETSFVIHYCPFCGIKLENNEEPHGNHLASHL